MSWYLVVKFPHILAGTITIGCLFARQLVRSLSRLPETEFNAFWAKGNSMTMEQAIQLALK